VPETTGAPWNWRIPDSLGNDFFKTGFTAIRNLAADIAASMTTLNDRTTVGTWTDIVLATGFTAGVGVDKPQYRREGQRVFMKGWVKVDTAKAALALFTATALPAELRPLVNQTAWGFWETAPQTIRLEITTAGHLQSFIALNANQWINLGTVTWSIGA